MFLNLSAKEKLVSQFSVFDLYPRHVQLVEMTPAEQAAASLRNAKSYTQQALKTGALDDASIELIDQAEAIMQMVLDNLQKQPVPAEVSHRLANVVNELCACEKLCNGEIKTAVYDLSVATERLRDRIA